MIITIQLISLAKVSKKITGCTVAPPVLMATGFVDQLQNRHHSTVHQKICHRWLHGIVCQIQ